MLCLATDNTVRKRIDARRLNADHRVRSALFRNVDEELVAIYGLVSDRWSSQNETPRGSWSMSLLTDPRVLVNERNTHRFRRRDTTVRASYCARKRLRWERWFPMGENERCQLIKSKHRNDANERYRASLHWCYAGRYGWFEKLKDGFH